MKRKIELATTENITSTYAGQFAGMYIAAALLEANTIANGGLTVRTNIKFKETVKRLAITDDFIVDATCDFTPTSTITLTERILQPEEFQVNLQLCKKSYREDWEAEQMGFSVYDRLPPKFSDFLIGEVAARVATRQETNIWVGDEANTENMMVFQSYWPLMRLYHPLKK